MDFGVRKRPLLLITIFYIIGLVISSNLSTYISFGIISCFTLSALIFRKSLTEYKNILLSCIIAMSLGALLYTYTDKKVGDKYQDLNDSNVELTGSILDIQQDNNKTSLVVNNITIKSEFKKEVSGGKLLIYLSPAYNGTDLNPGSKIKATGQLSKPKGVRNPGGFNYKRYLTSKGISATVFVNNSDFMVIEKGSLISLRYVGFKLRNHIINSINAFIPDKEAALLCGMLIGYTEGLEEETVKQFRDAGLSHIMAVSGSNVAFILAPLFFLFRRIGLSKRVTSIILIPVLILFIFITGFSASVARAVIMAITVLVGKFLYRDTDTLTLIAFSMIILLLQNPFLVFDAGFQLSYGATLGIILFYKSIYDYLIRLKAPKSIAALMGVTFAAQIGVFPISIYHFNRVSIISIISNLIVVPITEAITIIGFMMVIVGGFSAFIGSVLAASNMLLLTFILETTKISAAIPYAAVNFPTPNLLQVITIYTFVLYFINLRQKQRLLDLRKEIILSFIAIFIILIPIILPIPFTMYFLDVGQGDSIFIQTDKGKNILIDGGGYTSTKSRDNTMGEAVIVPFLMEKGINKLDAVVLTHGHDDHMAGLFDVIKNVKVKNLFISKNFTEGQELDEIIELALKEKVKIYEVEAGGKITIDEDTFFKAVFPDENFYDTKHTLNNTSLVLQLKHKGFSALFCGDLEDNAEEFLLEKGTFLLSDIIKIGHHGSSTSSSEAFIKAVEPNVSVISVGKNNFGHPSPSVLGRLNDSGTKIYRTDESGAVIISLSGHKIKIKRMVTDK